MVRTLIRVATFTHAPDLLDAGAAAAQLRLAQQGVRYVDGGWATIVASLMRAAHDRGVEVQLDAAVSGVERGPAGLHVVVDGRDVEATSVVLAAGGPATANRLLASAGGAVVGLDRLGPPAQVTVLDLGTTRVPVHPVVFGVDEPWYLSTHGPAAAGLAPKGRALVTVMRYLAPDEGGGSFEAALAEFARSTGIDDDEIVMRRYLHRMTATHGFPLATRRWARRTTGRRRDGRHRGVPRRRLGRRRPGCCPTPRRRAARRRAGQRRAAWWRRGCDVQGETLTRRRDLRA